MIEKPTFVASIRCDIKNIASIALFLQSRGVHKDSLAKVASEAIRILAFTSQEIFPISSTTEAVQKLRAIGYENTLKKNTRYYKNLFGQIKLETDQTEVNITVSDLVEKESDSLNKLKTELSLPPSASFGD